jgi:hypothetical protein
MSFYAKIGKSFITTDQLYPDSKSEVGISAVRSHLASVLASRSWRVTRPLRTGMSLLRKMNKSLILFMEKFLRALATRTMHLGLIRVAFLTKRGIKARNLNFLYDLNPDFVHARISFSRSYFVFGRKKNNSKSDVHFVITQDIDFDPYLIFRFCLLWVELGSNSTLYCDFQERRKGVFFKGEWDFLYDRSVSLLSPIYMESTSYSSLRPIKLSKAAVKLRPVDEYAQRRSSTPNFGNTFVERSKMEKTVSIIIPTANKIVRVDGKNRWLIGDIVSEIASMKRVKVQFIIVHNGNLTRFQMSKLRLLGDVKFVAYLDPHLNLSKKFNLGVEFAINENLLLANDDIRGKSQNWIVDLIKWFDMGITGVVAPKIFYENDLLQYAGIEISKHLPNILGYRRHGLDQGYGFSFDVPRKLDAATGVLMATTKTVFNRVGGWNESLPINFNDIEYCLRVRKAGYSVIYEPSAQIYHLESASRDSSLPFKEDFEYFKECCQRYNLKSIWSDLSKKSNQPSPYLGFDWFFGQVGNRLFPDVKSDLG